MKKSYRIKRNQDFKALLTQKRNKANRKFVVYQMDSDLKHFRVGLSVSKRLGNAVMRNRIKRHLRHLLQKHQDHLAPVDILLIARKGVEELSYAEMEQNLLHVLKLAAIYQKEDECEEKENF
ncbi:ribonuclease P protein component [Streptococcus danieliae]|nr:ribonuclease P protein component [Streptococcus danieliae]